MFVRRRGIAVWMALFGGACAAQPSPAPEAKLRPQEAPFVAACHERCERTRAMQAVAIEMIRAGCAEECRQSWALPLLTARAQVAPQEGQRVRLFGLVAADGEGWALALEDGSRLPLISADPGPPPLGAAVVIGTLEAGSVVGAWVLPQKAEEKDGM